jgi:8-oxo-dGTP diphosphatase
MDDPASKFATPRIAAGALFVDGDRVLLVRKTYGNRSDPPGGYVDKGESPAAACRRELQEELGLDRSPVRLLVQDWAPSEQEGDEILFVFSCGALGTDKAQIRLDGKELDRWEWVPIGKIADYVIPRLQRRIGRTFEADRTSGTFHLEHGQQALMMQ